MEVEIAIYLDLLIVYKMSAEYSIIFLKIQIVRNELLWLSSSISLMPGRRLLLHISSFSFFFFLLQYLFQKKKKNPLD